MKNLIIQKPALKFTIEVVAKNNELNFNVVRYIDVAKNESLETNAKLSKNDALLINGHHINCNDIMKSAISGIETSMLPHTLDIKKDCKIRLKKSSTFGY